jgi:hypothetical protein
MEVWSLSIREIVELMKGPQPKSVNYEYYSRILQYKYMEKTEQNTKRLVCATWGLAIVSALLVLVTFIK